MLVNAIQIISERHSGSNWFVKLLKENFAENVQIGDLEKHWFVNEYKLNHFLDNSFTSRYKLEQECFKKDINYETFNNITSDNILVIILVRNVHDWILGMQRDPHHFNFKDKIEIKKLQLSQFIRMNWFNKRDISNEFPIVKNVVDLRTKKYENWLHYLPKFCKHIEIIPYEKLLINYPDVLRHLSYNYNFKIRTNLNKLIINNNSKMKNSIFYNKNLMLKNYSKNDLDYINKFIKFDIERKIGYYK